MATFLNTKKAVSEIEDLMRNADQKLILISPYLKLSKDFKELLKYRNSKDKITTVIFGKQELNPKEMEFLEGLQFVILKYNQDLHAKCYINDDKMIITSLNLYEFSMNNNKEMGVLIDKNNEVDIDLYNEAYKEVDFINETSERFKFTSAKDSHTNDNIISDKLEKKISKAYSNSKYYTTKEISKELSISSRKINSILTDDKLMYKKDDDWHLTKKGKELGGKEKIGQYGRFVIWPKGILDLINEN
jgi:phosphatidylserine/phosphatidylglycerophosphate/cardiolipin synthase-like enzyme